MVSSKRLHLLVALAVFALVSCSGKPEYPACEGDQDCGQGEFCINQLCQQCRENKDCGEGSVCKGGRCEAIAGFCNTTADCTQGLICKDKRCVACTDNSECGNGRCSSGRCIEAIKCQSNDDCPDNQECVDGFCLAPPPGLTDASGQAPCSLPDIYFHFDESVVTSESSAELQNAAECLRNLSKKAVTLEGHCDPRGTEAYNLSLGERRANSVKTYLERLGVSGAQLQPLSKGKLEATGTNEETWAQDRRVEFVW